MKKLKSILLFPIHKIQEWIERWKVKREMKARRKKEPFIYK